MRLCLTLLFFVLPLAACKDKDGADSGAGSVDTEDTGIPLTPFVQVSAGSTYSCGLREAGNVTCWGTPLSDLGQTSPPDGIVFTKISVGDYHACGVTEDEEIECWGTPQVDYGQTDAPAAIDFVDVNVGDFHTCGRAADNALSCWGDDTYGQVSDAPGNVLQVDAGGNNLCAVLTTSTPFCWGETAPPGTEEDDPNYNPPLNDIFNYVTASDSYSGCGAPLVGGVTCWGDSQAGEATAPSGVNLVQMEGSAYHVCGVNSSGAVTCWGDNSVSQSSPPADVVFDQVAVGDYHTCGVTSDGKVACWGDNYNGQSSPPQE
jgi:hypothetical protein